MSNDEPRAVKYGMPASESQRFLANHFVVMQERALIKELHFQHALRIGPALHAALDGPEGEADPSPGEPELPPTVAAEPLPSEPDDLRATLGLQ